MELSSTIIIRLVLPRLVMLFAASASTSRSSAPLATVPTTTTIPTTTSSVEQNETITDINSASGVLFVTGMITLLIVGSSVAFVFYLRWRPKSFIHYTNAEVPEVDFKAAGDHIAVERIGNFRNLKEVFGRVGDSTEDPKDTEEITNDNEGKKKPATLRGFKKPPSRKMSAVSVDGKVGPINPSFYPMQQQKPGSANGNNNKNLIAPVAFPQQSLPRQANLNAPASPNTGALNGNPSKPGSAASASKPATNSPHRNSIKGGYPMATKEAMNQMMLQMLNKMKKKTEEYDDDDEDSETDSSSDSYSDTSNGTDSGPKKPKKKRKNTKDKKKVAKAKEEVACVYAMPEDDSDVDTSDGPSLNPIFGGNISPLKQSRSPVAKQFASTEEVMDRMYSDDIKYAPKEAKLMNDLDNALGSLQNMIREDPSVQSQARQQPQQQRGINQPTTQQQQQIRPQGPPQSQFRPQMTPQQRQAQGQGNATNQAMRQPQMQSMGRPLPQLAPIFTSSTTSLSGFPAQHPQTMVQQQQQRPPVFVTQVRNGMPVIPNLLPRPPQHMRQGSNPDSHHSQSRDRINKH